ncbi:MAG: Trm112 family protein [Anaeromyxobacteraceae bacterium]
MALSPDLKEILACPRCKGDLEFHEDRGEIDCLRCRLAYRIDDGIPVMLVDEARPLGGADSTP